MKSIDLKNYLKLLIYILVASLLTIFLYVEQYISTMEFWIMMGLTLIQIIFCIVVLVLKDDKIFINDYIFGIPTESLSLLAFVFCHEMPMTMRIIIPIIYLVTIFIFLTVRFPSDKTSLSKEK